MNLLALVEGGALIALCFIFGRLWLEARRRLKSEHVRYFEDSPDMLCTAGFDGYFKNVNISFLRVLGYTEKDMRAQPFINFVHEADKEATIEASLKLSEGERVTEFENRYLCKNGTWKWLMWNSKADALYGVIIASAKDISKRKDLEESLRVSQVALIKSLDEERKTLKVLQEKADALFRSNQELASFAHVVAHDLQEPLRTMTSYCAILEENAQGLLSTDNVEILAFITDASRRMKELIRDLLIYGRVDHRELTFVSVPLMDVMNEVRLLLKGAIDVSKANIIYDTLPVTTQAGTEQFQAFEI